MVFNPAVVVTWFMVRRKGRSCSLRGTNQMLAQLGFQILFLLFLLWQFWEVLKCLVLLVPPPGGYRGGVPALEKLWNSVWGCCWSLCFMSQLGMGERGAPGLHGSFRWSLGSHVDQLGSEAGTSQLFLMHQCWCSCRHQKTETVLESNALPLMSRAKRINATEGKNAMIIIIINFCPYRSPCLSAAGAWGTQELGKHVKADCSVLISAILYKVADQAKQYKMKIIKVAIGLSILKLILHYFIRAAWWNFNFFCLSTVLCFNVSFFPWPVAPALCLLCSKWPHVGVSIAQLISGSQRHSEGPKKGSEFSTKEPLLSWMCASSSV